MIEFSKKLLIMDYLIMIVLFILTIFIKDTDFITIDVAWITQLGLSTGAYYWKTRTENRTKIPFKVIESLPDSVRNEINLTEIITSIINSQ